MPSTVKVKVKSARNLPVMDTHHKQTAAASSSASGNNKTALSMSMVSLSMGPPSTDAYVVVTLGGHVNLTDQEEESSQSKQKRYTQKTKVCKRTLNPVWDEGVYEMNHRIHVGYVEQFYNTPFFTNVSFLFLLLQNSDLMFRTMRSYRMSHCSFGFATRMH